MNFSKLNALQREAVEELDRNILLLAPAGTGKTNTLACRIVRIIEQDRALPEEILCLTFTNKACREMRERISRYAGETGKRVIVRTFHGFCYDVVKTEAKRHSDWFADFTIFDETDCRGLLRECLGEEWPVAPVQELIGQLKEKRAEYEIHTDDARADYERTIRRLIQTDPESVRRHAVDDSHHFYAGLFEGWQAWGADLASRYDDRLHSLHGLDFTDLIVRAGQLFSDPEVALKWARRFVYMNIDEVQDTSELEYRILSRIFGSSHLLLCGDYFQTIYEWRGSHPEQVLRQYQQDCGPRRIVLHENYRSSQVILDASFACLRSFFPERVAALYPEGMQSVGGEKGAPIVIKGALDAAEEAQWIYYTIQQLPVTDYSQVCVLTRNNACNRILSEQFRSLGRCLPKEQRLPFMLLDESKFFRRQEVKDALAFLRLVVNPNDVFSLVRILNRFGQGIGPTAVRTISSRAYRQAGLRLTDFIDAEARRNGDPFAALLRAWAKEDIVVFDVESTGLDTARDEIIQIAGVRLTADGKVKAEFRRVLRPERSVGESVRVHGMSDEWLARHGQDSREVLQDFCRFAAGTVLAGHNVTYDLHILSSQLSRLGLPPLDYAAYVDTLELFRRFHPELPNHRLEFLGRYCKTEHRSSHDAADDVLATAEILHFAIVHDIRPSEAERREFFAKWQEKFTALAEMMDEFRQQAAVQRPWQLIGHIVVRAGLDRYYLAHHEPQRVEHLRDLFRQARDLDDGSLAPLEAIERFLRDASLSNTELDALARRSQIPIITVHQAKGAEFDYVFLAGLQDGTFPGFRAERNGSLNEEKRLFYVGITRARKQLFLSWSQQHYGYYRQMSRFLLAIPRSLTHNE